MARVAGFADELQTTNDIHYEYFAGYQLQRNSSITEIFLLTV